MARQWKSWDSNWRPWSVVIVCGQSKRDIQPESRARDTVCGDVWERKGFWPAGEVVHCSEAAFKSCRGRHRTDEVNVDMEEANSREGRVVEGSDCVARNLTALAGLASSGPSATVFLNGWPHEALGDELSRCLDAWVAEGMKYVMAERRRDVWSWYY